VLLGVLLTGARWPALLAGAPQSLYNLQPK
jgi:hypothetical protein